MIVTAAGIRIIIHVGAASNRAIAGTDLRYFMRVDGNKVTIETSTVANSITGVTAFAYIEFVKAD
jgi:hypothetical protein